MCRNFSDPSVDPTGRGATSPIGAKKGRLLRRICCESRPTHLSPVQKKSATSWDPYCDLGPLFAILTVLIKKSLNFFRVAHVVRDAVQQKKKTCPQPSLRSVLLFFRCTAPLARPEGGPWATLGVAWLGVGGAQCPVCCDAAPPPGAPRSRAEPPKRCTASLWLGVVAAPTPSPSQQNAARRACRGVRGRAAPPRHPPDPPFCCDSGPLGAS